MLVKECIALDWARLKKTLKRSITNPPGQDLGEAEFDMPDHFVLLSQSYRRYQLGHLIQTIAFGEDFSLLEETEIITKSKNVTFVHIASGRRFEDFLQVQGDVASQYVDEEKDLFFSAVGKVNVVKNGKNIIGYIVDETFGGKWEILLRNNETIYLPPVKYVLVTEEDDSSSCLSVLEEGYQFIIDESKEWNITEYWPIRMKFVKNAIENWQYSLSRLVVNTKGEVNQHLSS